MGTIPFDISCTISTYKIDEDIINSMFSLRIELELEFVSSIEANFDVWDQSVHVFLIGDSFLRKGIPQSLCVNKTYTYELNHLGGVLSMALKLSLPP